MGGQHDHPQRQRCTGRKAACGGQRGLHRPSAQHGRDAEFIARMRAERVVRHQLLCDLFRERGIETAAHIDGRQFAVLGSRLGLQFDAFPLEVGLLRVGLRVNRNVFSGGHRHGPGHQPGDRRGEDASVAGMGRRYAGHQTGRRHNAVVGTQHGCAQPADTVGAVAFPVGAAAWGCHRLPPFFRRDASMRTSVLSCRR